MLVKGKIDYFLGSLLNLILNQAFEISQKFLNENRSRNVVQLVGPKLVEMKKATQAAELYFKVDLIKECIDAFIVAKEWTKARKVAEQLDKS
jgi:hypothetical protein